MTNRHSLQLPIFILLLTVFFPCAVLSNTDAESMQPKQIIQDMTSQFEKDLASHQKAIAENPSITENLINQHLIPQVNFKLLSRYVLGKNWKKTSKQQQDEFISLFKTLLIRFYSNAFTDYIKANHVDEGMTTILPFRAKSDSKYSKVQTEVKINPNKPKIKVNYSLYKGKTKGWKVYDISVEGISLVSNYRSSFNQIIKKEGMDGLLAHLKRKTGS